MDLLSSVVTILGLAMLIAAFVIWVTNSIKSLRNAIRKLDALIRESPSMQAPEAVAEAETADVHFTEADVRNALNYHHLTVDESDSEPNEYLSFCSNQLRFVILTNKLPCLSIRCYFSINPENKDFDLMEQIAGEVTLDYMFVKVFVSREDASYCLQVDMVADSYASFCNVLPLYLDSISRGHQTINNLYDERAGKKQQTTQNALYAAALAAQTDAAGNIIAS